MEFIYETKRTTKIKNTTVTEKAKSFFEENKPTKNETFFVVKSSFNKENEIDAYGLYFGNGSSPVYVEAQTNTNVERIFLTEALDTTSVINFIEKNNDENIYLFKVIFEDFEMKEITSFYSKKHKMDIIIYKDNEEKEEVLEVFGKSKVNLVIPLL